MMNSNDDYYVYVYIDPRNNEEFYYGKGRGNRKLAHLKEKSDSAKVRRIKDIRKEGEKPRIKVIAADLTQDQAWLIESTMLWKLGKTLTNKNAGGFVSKFRPHNTLHKELPRFDFNCGIYLVNVGEGVHRCWNDCQKYGFLAAGHGRKYSRQLERLQIGDVVVPYLNKHGYVGIGIVMKPSIRLRDFRWKEKALKDCPLQKPNIYKDSDNADLSDYLVTIHWKKKVDAESAKWKRKFGLFTTQLVCASLAKQTKTLSFVEDEFRVCFKDLSKE